MKYQTMKELMTINYLDGRSVEAVLLSRTEQTLRVAVQGAEDVIELANIRGTWVSDECEPVSIRFAWQRNGQKPCVSEDDFCCSHELAAKLTQALFTGANEETIEFNAPQPTEWFHFASTC
jgi:hypothetical protein